MIHVGISVIICCYNSESRLPNTLLFLSKQKITDDLCWEVIVVDNCSSDNTCDIAEAKLKDFCFPNFSYKIVHEKTPGLNNARLKGVETSQYKYLLFCDDDNWLKETYMSNGFKIFKQDSKIGVLGGVGIPVFEGVAPPWFNKYHLYFATGKQSDTVGDVSNSRAWVYGAGFFINKYALSNIYSYNFITTDRKGKGLSSGGDLELCFYIASQGYKIWYSEELEFFHFVESSRLQADYLKRLMIAGANSAYHLDGLYYKAVNPVTSSWLKRKWLGRFIIDVFRIKDFKGDEYISSAFKFKLHLLRIMALLRLNFSYDRSFK